ncbi:MAG: AMP-binding protein, partial [Sulfobacillus sp.]
MSPPAPARLYEEISVTAARRANQPATSFLDSQGEIQETLTFSDLMLCAEQIARNLHRLRLEPGSPIGILLNQQRSQITHFLGALQAGLVPAILTPYNHKLDRQSYTDNLLTSLATCDISVLVSDLQIPSTEVVVLAPDTLQPTASETVAARHSVPDS